MTLLRRAIQRELVDFVDKLNQSGVDINSVSKAAFCKARKKLRPEAFIKLNEILLTTFYDKSNRDVKLWKEYRLLASDGSSAEVPNSGQIQQQWGVFKERTDGKKICMARIEQTYDVLNHMAVVSSIDSFNVSEATLFWQHLEQLKPIQEKDLHVLDRYYASHLLMFYLNHRKDQFCFRMKKDWWKVVERFYNSEDNDQIITISLPNKDIEKARKLGIEARQIKCRLVKILLDSGETEILLTSLTDQSVSMEDLKELYGLRWAVETSFGSVKHKVELENFSGKSIRVVKQDYFAKVFMLNYAALLIRPVNKILENSPKEKYTHKVNLNEALARMKYAVVELFLFDKIKMTLDKLYKAFYAFTEPIRHNRKFKRHKLPKRKYHRNYCHI